MDILIIGGTGFISRCLARQLLERGERVTLLTRGRMQPDSRAESLVADRTRPGDLARAVGERMFDVVYDLIAYRPEESAESATVFTGRTGRFIHCSTVSVYMVSDKVECPITEDQDRAPVMPFWDRNPFGMDYGIRKRLCEDVLWARHDHRDFPVTMLRPTYVSGPADPAGRDFFWIERILDGGPLLVPGTGAFRFQQAYVEDVARAFISVMEKPASIGQAYNVAGEEEFTTNEYIESLCRLLGRNPEIVHLDQARFDGLPISTSPSGDVFPFNPRRDAVFSLDKAKRHLGFRSTPFENWMAQTIRWWKNAPHGHSNGYERRSEELALIKEIVH
jgi:nucleoside-diphosphate-sugar epimerase